MPAHAKDGKKAPATADERHDLSVEIMRMARWTVGEITHTELHERLPHVPPGTLNVQVLFHDDYVAALGNGLTITERGRLYMRMVDGM